MTPPKIVACDVPIDRYALILERTRDDPTVLGYKNGIDLVVPHGLHRISALTRQYAPGKQFIYDHQKAGRDTPFMGRNFAQALSACDVDHTIIYPNVREPETAGTWIREALQAQLSVIVGAWMTTPRFAISEGGHHGDEDILDIYRNAYRYGVRRFVVPGNKIMATRRILASIGGDITLYAPGFGAQGGSLENFTAAMQCVRWYPIVGRSFFLKDEESR